MGIKCQIVIDIIDTQQPIFDWYHSSYHHNNTPQQQQQHKFVELCAVYNPYSDHMHIHAKLAKFKNIEIIKKDNIQKKYLYFANIKKKEQ